MFRYPTVFFLHPSINCSRIYKSTTKHKRGDIFQSAKNNISRNKAMKSKNLMCAFLLQKGLEIHMRYTSSYKEKTDNVSFIYFHWLCYIGQRLSAELLFTMWQRDHNYLFPILFYFISVKNVVAHQKIHI